MIANLLDRGMRGLQRQLDAPTFTYRGRTLPCLPNTLSRGDKLALGGWEGEIALTIYVLKSLVSTLAVDTTLTTVDADTITGDDDRPQPHPGKKIDHRQREYRIGRVSEDGAGVYWKVDLVDPDNG